MEENVITNEEIHIQNTDEKKSNKKQIYLIVFCWISYIIAYLGRYGFSANINLIIDEYGVTKSQVGLVTAFFFFAYGIGQIVNGIFSKKYNKRIIVPISLFVSAILNICIFIGIPFEYFKFLWLINGFVQAILWPTMIEILSKNLNQSKLKTAIIFMSTATPVGTLLVYGSSALLVSLNTYKTIFILAFVVMIITGIIWFFLFNKCTNKNIQTDVEQIQIQPKIEKHDKKSGILIIFISIMAIFAIFDNFIKDGLTTWMPVILKDIYSLADNASILLTIILPVLGTFGALLAIFLNRYIKNYSLLTAFFYAISFILLTISVFVVRSNAIWIVLIILLGLTVLNMHSVNNIVTSMVPLFMRDKINSGFLAGLLNGFCYLGSTISSYGLGKIVDTTNNWNYVLYLLILGTIICSAIGLIHFIAEKIKNKKMQ